LVGHDLALSYVRERMLGRPVTEQAIVDLHSMVLPAQLLPAAGHGYPDLAPDHCYRRWTIHVVGSPKVCPYPHEVPALMRRLLALHNRRAADPAIHAFTRAVLFKMDFLDIHPFADGNGRAARLLLNCMLHDAGFYSGCVVRACERPEYMAHFRPYISGAVYPMVRFLLQRTVCLMRETAAATIQLHLIEQTSAKEKQKSENKCHSPPDL
jgi:hypothetical protein